MRAAHIIGVSLDLGGNRRGVDMGPSAFRIAGLAERLSALGFPVVDEGDLVAPIPEIKAPGTRRRSTCGRSSRSASDSTDLSLSVLERGGIPIVLGGDHSVAAGSVAATAAYLRRSDEAARADLGRRPRRHEYAGDLVSGNVHGMPLPPLLGAEPAELSRIGGFSPKVLGPHTPCSSASATWTSGKARPCADSGVKVFTIKDIDRAGIAAVIEQALAIAGNGTAGVHVSFDLDVCDPRSRPAWAPRSKAGSTTAKRTC